MGQLILALNPLDGSRLKLWDFKDDVEAGAIGGGVTPVQMFLGDDQSQRIYWADYKGNINAIGSHSQHGELPLDSAWITAISRVGAPHASPPPSQ